MARFRRRRRVIRRRGRAGRRPIRRRRLVRRRGLRPMRVGWRM